MLRKGVDRVVAFYTNHYTYNSFALQFYKDDEGSCVVHPFFHTHVQLVKVFGLKH